MHFRAMRAGDRARPPAYSPFAPLDHTVFPTTTRSNLFSLKNLLVASVLVTFIACCAVPAAFSQVEATRGPKRVLILYSMDKEETIYAGFDQVLRSTLRSALPQRVEFYTEYLDLVRFPDADHLDNLDKLLRIRLAEKKPDLIIPVSYAALNFFLSRQPELAPGTPIVALFNQRRTEELKERIAKDLARKDLTGVEGRDEPARSIDLALQLQPDTRQVVVVVGSSPLEKYWMQQLQQDFSGYAGRLSFTYLTDLPMDGILQQVAKLPSHSIVLSSFFLQDGSGQFFPAEEAIDLITRASSVPVYGTYLPLIGHEIIGGRMEDPSKIAVQMADMAKRVLGGERAEDIPMEVDDSLRDVVDWRQLRRWKIEESRIPAGTLVLFREPSSWSRYRWLILGVALLCALETVLILGLLVQRRHRTRAETALRKEKAFSDTVIESLPGIFYLQNEKGDSLRWNKNLAEVSGYERQEAKNKTFIAEEFKDASSRAAQEALDSGSSQIEADFITKNGERLSYYLKRVRLQLEDRRYIIGMGIDITDRKKTEGAIKAIVEGVRGETSAEFFCSMALQLSKSLGAEQAIIGELSRDKRMIRTLANCVNGTIVQNITYDLDGSPCGDVMRKGVCSYTSGVAELFPQDTRLWNMKMQAYTGVPLRNSQKQVVGIMAAFFAEPLENAAFAESILQVFSTWTAAEIERQRAEEELRQAEERFSKAFQSSPDGIAISTLTEGRYIEVNDATLRLLGYSREEMIGRTAIELGVWESVAERSAMIEQLLAHGPVHELEVRMRTKSREIRHLRMSVDVVQLQNRLCLITIVRDLTEQDFLQQQLREAQKMEAMARLAGGVAHDFNNLLGAIIGYSDLLTQSLPADSDSYRRVEGIRNAGWRAASVAAQLLAFSRKQVLQPRVVNLNSTVAETGKLLQHLLGEDVELILDLDPEALHVNADPGQMVQVIMNLAVNARDAMPNGGKLSIETAKYTSDPAITNGSGMPPGSYVRLAVSDTGIGIDADTKEKIFEPLFTTKPIGKGTGLGLATVKGIVEQSGGCVSVESEMGRGATFRVYLPRVMEDAEVAVAFSMPALPRGSETILLVEDDAILRDLVCESLQASGYHVLAAENGVDALRVAEQHAGPIRLLITDVIMPQMSGPELVKSLNELRPGLDVLYMSGYADDKLAEGPVLDRDIPLIQKPFHLGGLTRKVQEILGRGPKTGLPPQHQAQLEVAEPKSAGTRKTGAL
jgi:two-component system, cell cycle sensor histidine kinase and response regulator CckA